MNSPGVHFEQTAAFHIITVTWNVL